MAGVVEARKGRIIAWRDRIPLRFEYTAGVAGETFLRMLSQGKIVAGKCMTCGDVRVPPRIYCLNCGGQTRIDVELLHFGRLSAVSTVRLGRDGKRLGEDSRKTFGYVTFEGVSGGILHRVMPAGRATPKIGDIMRPLFRPAGERRGSVLDLEGFQATRREARSYGREKGAGRI